MAQTTNVGHMSAWSFARSKGYTGTSEEFAELMASYATVAQQAAESAGNASQSAQSASQSATDAETAKGTAQQAATDAQTAQASAQDYAQSAQQSAQSASQAAQNAESAKNTAVDAVDGFAAGAQQALDGVNQAGNNWKSLAQARALDSEAYALGTRGGEDVGSSDPAYHNNAKYYAESARDAAAQSASEAAESARTMTIDATLTQSGQAADAKVTGDRFEKIENAIESYEFDELFSELQISESQNLYNKDTAEDGYIAANGTVSPSTTYCHSTKIPVEAGKTYTFWALYNGNVVSANARFLCAYDPNGDAISSAGSNSAVPSYTVPTGINSIAVSFEQNRKYLFMVVEGSETPNRLLPYNLEHYIAKPSFISSAVGDILRANEQIKISVENATANTDYTLVEHLDNKKNCEYSFFGKFTNFTSVEIGHGKTETAANYLVIDGTNITSYRPDGTEYAHYAHNLTIADFIHVSIKIADTVSQRATVTIITNGGSATVGNVIFFGCNGAIYFSCGQDTTSVDFAYSVMDLLKDVYVFGDSYISLADDKRWPHHAITNKDNNMLLSGFPGADAIEEFPSFEKILSMGTPKYLCWFIGMNNKETSAPNPNWIVVTSQVIAACRAKGIIPILATIPNTPTQNNTYKNSWVKASGERYVDFAKAVGAEELGSTWYTGMLSSDNVHPTAEGAKALWLRLRLDVPEIMERITT